MRIVVVQHGRLRDPDILSLRAEYLKRCKRFGSVTVIEKEPKGDAVLWPATSRWRVALDERGPMLTSVAFAEALKSWTMHHGEVAFLLGDAFTLHPPSRATANTTLSLSAMTLPHQLAHLLLIEQIYRAATILAGAAYHHA